MVYAERDGRMGGKETETRHGPQQRGAVYVRAAVYGGSNSGRDRQTGGKRAINRTNMRDVYILVLECLHRKQSQAQCLKTKAAHE